MMEKTKYVLYTDPFGHEHDALVTGVNGLHEGYATVIYIDPDAPESDNVKKVFDVAHSAIAPALHARFLGARVIPQEPVAPLPSAEDLDAVAAEQKAADATSGDTPAPAKPRVVKGSAAK